MSLVFLVLEARIHRDLALAMPSTSTQVQRGEVIYAAKCASCHGADLHGRSALSLAGMEARLRLQGQTAADLFQKVQTMPFGAPASLSRSEYLDLTAVILDRNGQTWNGELTDDVASLKQLSIGPGAHSPVEATLTLRRAVTKQIGAGPTQAELTAAGPNTAGWLMANHDYAGQRFVDLKLITRSNVHALRPICLYQLGDLHPLETNPLIYKGALFITSHDAAISLDAATCRLNWRYDRPSRANPSSSLKQNRGAAIKDGKLVYGTHDGFLIALDAGTGQVVWARDIVDPARNQGAFTMAPLIYEDLVVIGPAGSELGVKGWIGAFRLSTGEPVWRFNTIPDDDEPGATTWPDSASRQHGGGAIWGSLTLDASAGYLFVPVSNPSPDFEGDKRPGDNLFTDSIVVLNIHTGKLLWYYQVTPHDTHDYDLTQAGPLFSASIKGHFHHIVIAAGKEGLVNAVDRDTHELLYSVPITTRERSSDELIDVDMSRDGSRVCPGALGGVQGQGLAFDPDRRMLYVPSVDWCLVTKEPVERSRGWLTAIHADTGRLAWRHQSSRPVLSAVTATSAGLIFSGELTADLLALDARTGKELLRYNVGGPIIGGISTYQIGGSQYVAVVSGAASALWQADRGASIVAIFGLPGNR